jgi:C4-type Zn-finger protein
MAASIESSKQAETEISNIVAEIARLKELCDVAGENAKDDQNITSGRKEVFTAIEKAFDAGKITRDQKETFKDQLKSAAP